jgi:undecaprenyl-diphosphatase
MLDYLYFGFLARYDILINTSLASARSPFLTSFMLLVTSIMNYKSVIFLTLALFFLLIYLKKRSYSLLLISGLVFGALSEFLIKLGIHRIRPGDALIAESSYSFPSGHATISAVFFLILAYSLADGIKNKYYRLAFTLLCIFFFLLVGFSRIYLGVHWFSDVLAGFFLGLFWIFLSFFIFKNLQS